MTITPISDVWVGVLKEDGSGEKRRVCDSPFYISLRDLDEKPFDHYRNTLLRLCGDDHEITYTQFKRLRMDIWMNKFIVQEPRIRFDQDMVCLDGHHRLSILLHLHGERCGLEIINQEVNSVWVKSSR